MIGSDASAPITGVASDSLIGKSSASIAGESWRSGGVGKSIAGIAASASSDGGSCCSVGTESEAITRDGSPWKCGCRVVDRVALRCVSISVSVSMLSSSSNASSSWSTKAAARPNGAKPSCTPLCSGEACVRFENDSKELPLLAVATLAVAVEDAKDDEASALARLASELDSDDAVRDADDVEVAVSLRMLLRSCSALSEASTIECLPTVVLLMLISPLGGRSSSSCAS